MNVCIRYQANGNRTQAVCDTLSMQTSDPQQRCMPRQTPENHEQNLNVHSGDPGKQVKIHHHHDLVYLGGEPKKQAKKLPSPE